jgi:O-antigen/teichoic acid export membrane protein
MALVKINHFSSNKNKGLSVKTNFSYTLVANLVYAFSQWFIISLIAKLGTVEMVGRYSIALAVTAPIFLLSNMNLRSMQATDVKNNYSFINYFVTRIVTSTVALFSILFILLISNFNNGTKLIILLLSISRFLESICDVVYGLYQQNERMDFQAISKIIQSFLAILLFTFSMLVSKSLELSVLMYSLTFLIIIVFYDRIKILELTNVNILQELSNIRTIFNVSVVKKLIIIGFPLGISSAIDTLNANIPRYALQYFFNEESVGYFSSIAFIMTTGSTVINAMAHSAIPSLAKNYIENLSAYFRLLIKLIAFGLVIGFLAIIVSIFFGEIILQYLYTKEYKEYNNVFIVIMIASAIWYVTGFISSALTATTLFSVQVPIYIITLLATCSTSLILIPKFGLIGAALTVCIGNIIRLLCTLVAFFKVLKYRMKT